jgi:hypothetical protein
MKEIRWLTLAMASTVCAFERGFELSADKLQNNPTYPAAYNAPASYVMDRGWDLNVNGSFIYWFMTQDYMDIGWISPTVSSPTLPSGALAVQNVGYNPGFQVGIGVDSKCDGWTVNAEYTWYHNKESQSDLEAPSNTTGWNPNSYALAGAEDGALYQTLGSSWTLHLDQLDLVGGRPYYQGKNLIVTPMGGLRGLWIRQTETIVGNNPPASEHSTDPILTDVYKDGSRSWAVGVVGQASGKFLLGKGFRVDSLFGGSLLYTNYTTIYANANLSEGQYYGYVVGKNLSNVKNVSALRPTLEAGLGLGYASYLWNTNFLIDLSARYDFHFFWYQNVMRSFTSQMTIDTMTPGNLALHGLTVNLRCDF